MYRNTLRHVDGSRPKHVLRQWRILTGKCKIIEGKLMSSTKVCTTISLGQYCDCWLQIGYLKGRFDWIKETVLVVSHVECNALLAWSKYCGNKSDFDENFRTEWKGFVELHNKSISDRLYQSKRYCLVLVAQEASTWWGNALATNFLHDLNQTIPLGLIVRDVNGKSRQSIWNCEDYCRSFWVLPLLGFSTKLSRSKLQTVSLTGRRSSGRTRWPRNRIGAAVDAAVGEDRDESFTADVVTIIERSRAECPRSWAECEGASAGREEGGRAGQHVGAS